MSWFGLVICGPLGTYLLIFYVCHGDKSFAGTLTGVAGTVGALAGLLALPVIRWLANVFGKRSALFAGQFCVALGAVCSWFFFDPLHPWLALWSLTIQGIGVAFFVLLGNSILGDICDLDELKTGPPPGGGLQRNIQPRQQIRHRIRHALFRLSDHVFGFPRGRFTHTGNRSNLAPDVCQRPPFSLPASEPP